MNTKRKQKETYPAIPENCERFRRDEIGRWEFQFPGCIDDPEWEMVEVIRNLAGCVSCQEMRLLWRDLCNAARCAWMDECEPWEIDYAHCLAHAEAWAREASGE